jgi:hypothetical protein
MSHEAIQAEVQETFDYLVAEAVGALKQGGSFVPFGAGIRFDGERTHLNVDLPAEDSTPNQHIQGLIAAFRAEAETGALRLAGLVFDGQLRTTEGVSAPALVAHIEHDSGEGVQVFLPYRREGAAEVYLDAPVVERVEPEIFKAAA